MLFVVCTTGSELPTDRKFHIRLPVKEFLPGFKLSSQLPSDSRFAGAKVERGRKKKDDEWDSRVSLVWVENYNKIFTLRFCIHLLIRNKHINNHCYKHLGSSEGELNVTVSQPLKSRRQHLDLIYIIMYNKYVIYMHTGITWS